MDNGPCDQSSLFPPDFAWGVATSSHQVEGGNTNNQWAAWEKRGKIKSKDCVGLACDWRRNAEQDFDLAQSLGVNALRLSVEWSRIEPEEGLWDEAALARYRQMLKALHQRGMRPFVTLHHFTNPLWFEAKGAFLAPESILLFQRFTQRVVAALGDLCRDWVTFNEPNVYVSLGYFLGEQWSRITEKVHTVLLWATVAVAAAGLVYWWLRRRKNARNISETGKGS